MKLTKYVHACIVLEEQTKRLIIDPGVFGDDFGGTSNIAAVVVTHVHADHFDPKHLEAIIAANPDAKVFTTPEVAEQWKNPSVVSVKAGDTQTVGPFTLRFYGDLHAEIHSMAPRNQNVGVAINGFYYPGDSFVAPDQPVTVLGVPASAPWLKTGEAMDFVATVKPKKFIRTHDGMFNERGLATTDNWFGMASKNFGPEYCPLNPGDSIEI